MPTNISTNVKRKPQKNKCIFDVKLKDCSLLFLLWDDEFKSYLISLVEYCDLMTVPLDYNCKKVLLMIELMSIDLD